MLSVYTRHSADCPRVGDGAWRRCKCPKWIWGTLHGEFLRQSAKTRSWEHAEEFRRDLESASAASQSSADSDVSEMLSEGSSTLDGPPQELARSVAPSASLKKARVTLELAVSKYMADAKSRGLEASTLSKLDTLFRKQFFSWASSEGYVYVDELDLDALLNFRATWIDGALAKSKKQDRVIGFFWACIRRGYISQNPTAGMGKIRVDQVPTDYFPREEFNKIIDATHVYGDPRGGFISLEDLRIRLRAMTLLMRWSGLRIRDAVTFEKTRLHGDSVFLYQAKTGTPVYVPLPEHVVAALNDLPAGAKPNPRYYFWSGNGHPKSAVANWQRSYRRLFELANITRLDGSPKRCHPHMFRDTFAVENLLAGVPIDQVSLLLGHALVKITEKSYSPFVKARQLQLRESVRNAWQITEPLMAQAQA